MSTNPRPFTLAPLGGSAILAATRPGAALRELLDRLGPEAGLAFANALRQGVVSGWGPARTAQEATAKVTGLPRARALTIARTESLRAYRSEQLATWSDPRRAAGIESWTWLSSQDRTTCALCWAMHGTLHPLDEEMATHPNCRCTMVPNARPSLLADPRSLGPVIEPGPEAFARLPREVQDTILGQAKGKAYRRGTISLEDLVGPVRQTPFGPGRSELSLLEARRVSALRRGVRPPPRAPRKRVVLTEEQQAAKAAAKAKAIEERAARRAKVKAGQAQELAAKQRAAAERVAQRKQLEGEIRGGGSLAEHLAGAVEATERNIAYERGVIERSAQTIGDVEEKVRAGTARPWESDALAGARELLVRHQRSLDQLEDMLRIQRQVLEAGPEEDGWYRGFAEWWEGEEGSRPWQFDVRVVDGVVTKVDHHLRANRDRYASIVKERLGLDREAVRRRLRVVNIHAERSLDDAYWARTYGYEGGFESRASAGRGQMNWYNQRRNEAEHRRGPSLEQGTWDHEAGHLVGERGGPPEGVGWGGAMKDDAAEWLHGGVHLRRHERPGYTARGGIEMEAEGRPIILGDERGLTSYPIKAKAINEDWAESMRLLQLSDRRGWLVQLQSSTTSPAAPLGYQRFSFDELYPYRARLLRAHLAKLEAE